MGKYRWRVIAYTLISARLMHACCRYSLGGNVALHAAALDGRVAGVAAFAAFTPFRTDSNDRPTLGLRRLYDLHAVLPRLGFFAGNESAVPYDYDELVGSVAPKPVLLHTPQDDRDATCVGGWCAQLCARLLPSNGGVSTAACLLLLFCGVVAYSFADVNECANSLSKVWASMGAGGNFTHSAPTGETVMSKAESQILTNWLKTAA